MGWLRFSFKGGWRFVEGIVRKRRGRCFSYVSFIDTWAKHSFDKFIYSDTDRRTRGICSEALFYLVRRISTGAMEEEREETQKIEAIDWLRLRHWKFRMYFYRSFCCASNVNNVT